MTHERKGFYVLVFSPMPFAKAELESLADFGCDGDDEQSEQDEDEGPTQRLSVYALPLKKCDHPAAQFHKPPS